MKLDSPEALEARLRGIGAERYHDKHPFHVLMREGRLTRGQLQAWALNRYYYQSRIPIKDSALMSRVVDADLRREWSQRVVDHDGMREGQGGVAKWLHLCERLGLERASVLEERGVLPATRFAVDAYVHFVRERPLLEAIASSLTELFAPAIIGERTSAMLARYDFIDEDTLLYFSDRLAQAPRDANFALDYVKRHATTPEAPRDGVRGAHLQDRGAVGSARCAPLRVRYALSPAPRGLRPRRFRAMSGVLRCCSSGVTACLQDGASPDGGSVVRRALLNMTRPVCDSWLPDSAAMTDATVNEPLRHSLLTRRPFRHSRDGGNPRTRSPRRRGGSGP